MRSTTSDYPIKSATKIVMICEICKQKRKDFSLNNKTKARICNSSDSCLVHFMHVFYTVTSSYSLVPMPISSAYWSPICQLVFGWR